MLSPIKCSKCGNYMLQEGTALKCEYCNNEKSKYKNVQVEKRVMQKIAELETEDDLLIKFAIHISKINNLIGWTPRQLVNDFISSFSV